MFSGRIIKISSEKFLKLIWGLATSEFKSFIFYKTNKVNQIEKNLKGSIVASFNKL